MTGPAASVPSGGQHSQERHVSWGCHHQRTGGGKRQERTPSQFRRQETKVRGRRGALAREAIAGCPPLPEASMPARLPALPERRTQHHFSTEFWLHVKFLLRNCCS
ncbi:unnamed protein product [Rangifer tarandus platyrhynchus]|uniref:Uncharacterized protein n=1 Tax=Rangifer tarandus platyrhynchus TaxID=3082113 RepID=A0AC59YJJ6_RANTA